MHDCVFLAVACITESLVTEFTLEGLDTLVYTYVSPQVALVGEHLVAVGAGEVLHIHWGGVGVLVCTVWYTRIACGVGTCAVRNLVSRLLDVRIPMK